MKRKLQISRKSFVAILAVGFVMACSPNIAVGQAGFREALERLDKNQDGSIQYSEITPLARPFFEQLSKSRTSGARISLGKTYEITKLQEIARRFHAEKNGTTSGNRIQPNPEKTLLPFGPEKDKPLVPQFGLAKVRFPYNQDDLDFVERTMRSHDENKDGFIDRNEAARHEWTHRNPFDDDLDKDDRLSRMEMAQRYARRRLLEQSANELRQKAMRTGGVVRPSDRKSNERKDDSMWWRTGGSDFWLTASLMGRFDRNKNSRLDGKEIEELGMPIVAIDVDRDGEITREELFGYVRGVQNEVGGSAEGPPDWFYELDANKDDQVSIMEFATELTNEKLEEFATWDSNGDGLLTVSEASKERDTNANSYRNEEGELLPPRKTIVSTIDISDDVVIVDVDVQISISHTYVSYLDAYLVGPSGQRIELFTAIGGSDDHFDETVFDDESEEVITRARAPYQGNFKPEGAGRGEPGLSTFQGKSAKGQWQLIIRNTRSSRFGMLHGWKLLVTPKQ